MSTTDLPKNNKGETILYDGSKVNDESMQFLTWVDKLTEENAEKEIREEIEKAIQSSSGEIENSYQSVGKLEDGRHAYLLFKPQGWVQRAARLDRKGLIICEFYFSGENKLRCIDSKTSQKRYFNDWKKLYGPIE